MRLTFDLEGKTALVTGASSGLGVTFSRALAKAGANVVLAARRVDRLEQLAAEIESRGGKALTVKCDVGEPASVASTVAAAWSHFGRVDVLVNGARTFLLRIRRREQPWSCRMDWDSGFCRHDQP